MNKTNSRKIKQGALLPVNITLTRDESPVETIKSKSEQPYLEIQYPNGVKVVLYAEIPSKKLRFLIYNALYASLNQFTAVLYVLRSRRYAKGF